MQIGETQAFCEAVSRDLYLLDSGIAGEKYVVQARVALEQAASLYKLSKLSPNKVGTLEAGETLTEALALRREAYRGKDVARAEHWALQDESSALVDQLRELSERHCRATAARDDDAKRSTVDESSLLAMFKDLRAEVDALRREVEVKQWKVIAADKRGHVLGHRLTRLRRLHDDALAENEIAQEILRLQESTAAYMKQAAEHCDELDSELEAGERRCSARMQALCREWNEQQSKYQAQMDSLEARLTELQRDYDERWRGNALDTRQKLDERARVEEEAQTRVQAYMANIRAEEENTDRFTSEELERQRRLLEDGQQSAMRCMELALVDKKQVLNTRREEEERQCKAAREKVVEKTLKLRQKAEVYRKHIDRVRDNYVAPRPDLVVGLPSPNKVSQVLLRPLYGC